MAILNILRYPDPRLHKVAKPVTEFGERLKTLVRDMADTMYDAPGVGLAASQIDVHEQLLVIDVTESKDALQVFINPEITWASLTSSNHWPCARMSKWAGMQNCISTRESWRGRSWVLF